MKINDKVFKKKITIISCCILFFFLILHLHNKSLIKTEEEAILHAKSLPKVARFIEKHKGHPIDSSAVFKEKEKCWIVSFDAKIDDFFKTSGITVYFRRDGTLYGWEDDD